MIIIVIKRSCLMICIRLSDTSHGKKYRKIWALGHLYRNKFSVNLSQKWWMDQKVSFSFFYVSFILCNDVKWSFSLRRPSKDKKTHRLNFPFSVTPDNAAEHSTENGFLQWLPGCVCSVNAKHGSRKCSRDDTHHNPIIHFFLPMSVPPPSYHTSPSSLFRGGWYIWWDEFWGPWIRCTKWGGK